MSSKSNSILVIKAIGGFWRSEMGSNFSSKINMSLVVIQSKSKCTDCTQEISIKTYPVWKKRIAVSDISACFDIRGYWLTANSFCN